MTSTGPSSPLVSGERASEHPSEGSPVFRAIMGVAGRPFNAFVLRFAGSRYLRLYGVVHHRGRRSGRTYMTPVVVRPTVSGFVIPLAFGERADWFQNVHAAGSCEISWNGTTYSVVDPVVVDWPTARPAFSHLERIAAPLVGIERCVRVRRTDAGDPGRDVRTNFQTPVDAHETTITGSLS
jgi:deazaflavin-dependent oxidoreductase (nitroreductase family)